MRWRLERKHVFPCKHTRKLTHWRARAHTHVFRTVHIFARVCVCVYNKIQKYSADYTHTHTRMKCMQTLACVFCTMFTDAMFARLAFFFLLPRGVCGGGEGCGGVYVDSLSLCACHSTQMAQMQRNGSGFCVVRPARRMNFCVKLNLAENLVLHLLLLLLLLLSSISSHIASKYAENAGARIRLALTRHVEVLRDYVTAHNAHITLTKPPETHHHPPGLANVMSHKPTRTHTRTHAQAHTNPSGASHSTQNPPPAKPHPHPTDHPDPE